MSSKKTKAFIWGAGGHGRVVLDILQEGKKFDIGGFIDSNKTLKNKIIDGIIVFGDEKSLDNLKKKKILSCVVAIGDNKARCDIADYLEKRGFSLINAIHPRAIIAPSALLGKNVTVAAGAIICAHAVIEDNVIINTGAIVEHENVIKKGTHVAPGVRLAGRVEIREKVFIGVGSTVIQRVKIGDNSIIGAGSVVLNSIPKNVVAAGSPAKIIRRLDKKIRNFFNLFLK